MSLQLILLLRRDNFDELGEFIVYFRKYINNPYKNMHFNFMTRPLSPNNDYFLKHLLLYEEHTSKNGRIVSMPLV